MPVSIPRSHLNSQADRLHHKVKKYGKKEPCKKASKKSSWDKHHNKEISKKEKCCDKDKMDKGKSSKSSKK